ncbi:MAG: hypothetical protein Q4G59_01645 [Planctomycetia bacterium]|nr:hypothetical protein [Planctomycetia bacterium]
MTTLFFTTIVSIVFFGLMLLSLQLGRLFGRVRPRRCACAQSREILRQYEQRKADARRAARYSSETVNPQQLPIVDQGGNDH